MSRLVVCYIRRLNDYEIDALQKRTGTRYKWVTEGESSWDGIKVPPNFLSDGSSGGPDASDAWLIHDWLYKTHVIGDKPCTRREADDIMIEILKYQRFTWYARVAKLLLRCNPFWVASRAWKRSGDKGPDFI